MSSRPGIEELLKQLAEKMGLDTDNTETDASTSTQILNMLDEKFPGDQKRQYHILTNTAAFFAWRYVKKTRAQEGIGPLSKLSSIMAMVIEVNQELSHSFNSLNKQLVGIMMDIAGNNPEIVKEIERLNQTLKAEKGVNIPVEEDKDEKYHKEKN